MERKKKQVISILILIVLLLGIIIIALHLGTIKVPVLGGLQSIWQGLGIPVTVTNPLEPEQEAVLWYIRMPRILIGLMVGASLALAGAVMQGIFSNPLADPGIMGVSAGASQVLLLLFP